MVIECLTLSHVVIRSLVLPQLLCPRPSAHYSLGLPIHPFSVLSVVRLVAPLLLCRAAVVSPLLSPVECRRQLFVPLAVMSTDSAIATRRPTKRLRPVAESSLSGNDSSHTLLEGRPKRVPDAKLEPRERQHDSSYSADDASDEGEAQRGWPPEEKDEAEAVDDNAEDDSDGPPLIAHSATATSHPLSRSQPFPASSLSDPSYIRIAVPAHRYTPLKQQWQALYQPIVEHMKLQIRFNPKKRCVELRVAHTNTLHCSQHHSTLLRHHTPALDDANIISC